jgi:hypothetical protein
MTMALPPDSDEDMRLIRSLLDCVNAPVPGSNEGADGPFRWALDLARERKKTLRHRVNFHADAPAEQARNLDLAKKARATARGILWWLATNNDAELDEPVLSDRTAGRPKIWWAGLQHDAHLLEAPMIFTHFKVNGDSVTKHEVALWDRPSTCIAHALDLLLSDYRGLRKKVRACPYLSHDDGRVWDAKRIMSDYTLHFFVDDRFEKGQPQIYCSTQHRQTAYMRKYRAAAKHK